MNRDVMIQAVDLTKRFGDFVSVDRMSLSIPRGRVFGFLGPNGAGKTTTIRMLCGLLRPTAGRAVIAGIDVARHPDRVKALIGYMSQRFSLYGDLTVDENIAFYAGVYRVPTATFRERREGVLRIAGLEGLGRRLARELDGGHRQRLALACAVLHAPQVVFLDEPTSGVDPVARRAFWELIYVLSEGGTTVFVTTHYLEEAEFCERLGFVGAGRLIAEGTPAELKATLSDRAVYEIEADGQMAALEALRRLDDVASVAPFGSSIHVVTAGPGDFAGRIARALEASGAHAARIDLIPATLEDVFIHLTGGAKA